MPFITPLLFSGVLGALFILALTRADQIQFYPWFVFSLSFPVGFSLCSLIIFGSYLIHAQHGPLLSITMAVGLIIHADQAEDVVRSGGADLVALGRELLHNPNWPIDAAQKLGVDSPFSNVGHSLGYWLEKRAGNRAGIVPSTWQRGIASQ